MTTLRDLGEFGLIRRFAPDFLKNLPEGAMGIGDDCAVFPWGGTPGKRNLLITADLLVERTHFLKDGTPPEDLGRKALAVNLSDIAAMGGRPLMSVLSLALPKSTPLGWIDAFFAGYRELSEETGTILAGGDTTGSPDGIVINVTVLGEAPPDRTVYRSGAKPGDVICLTAPTGESGAGLRLVLDGCRGNADDAEARLIACHNRPRPHLEEGAFLAAQAGTHAMMDVSDGPDSDLRHILTASGAAGEIDLEAVPITRDLAAVCAERGWDAPLLALTAGEDYCLLAAVAVKDFNSTASAFEKTFGRPLAPIGRILPAEDAVTPDEESGKTGGRPETQDRPALSGGTLIYRRDGQPVTLAAKGFDHFAAEPAETDEDKQS